MTETIVDLRKVSSLVDTMQYFRERFMDKMYKSRAVLKAKDTNTLSAIEYQQYTDLCDKIAFLESMMDDIKMLSNYVAVMSRANNLLIEGVKDKGLLKEDGFSIALTAEEAIFMRESIERIEKISHTYLGIYKK